MSYTVIIEVCLRTTEIFKINETTTSFYITSLDQQRFINIQAKIPPKLYRTKDHLSSCRRVKSKPVYKKNILPNSFNRP